MTRFPDYRDSPDMAELTADLRLTHRRLKAALKRLQPRWTYKGREFGDAMICRDVLRQVRFERRRPPLQRSRFMLNVWGAQIDALCRWSAREA